MVIQALMARIDMTQAEPTLGCDGPGQNLFMFIHDADGNWVELSAELEIVAEDRPVGAWTHERRTLNSWGQGLLRS